MSGIFGVISRGDCTETLFYGVDYHSHLGTQYGGLAVLGERFNRQIHDISQSQFKSKFFQDYKSMAGNKGIGVISASDEQPIFLSSKFGPFCIVTNGLIENTDKLVKELLAAGISFSEVSRGAVNQTELVAKIISQGDDITGGIERVFEIIEGACSVLILNEEGIYAARDGRGHSPLILGKRGDDTAVTTETSAFTNNGFKVTKYLGPGEIVLMTEDGLVQKRGAGADNKVCAFLWIYTGFPASSYEGVNVELARERCGRKLAQRDADVDVDIVSGVPDSGIAHALGYAAESGKPYRRPLVKYTPGYGRSYTPPSQETRDLIAKMKLVPIEDIIRGNRIVVCEDSIVRGTQLKNFTVKKLWDAGAREIHARPACPPLMFPCRYNLSTRSINELAARKAIRAIEGYDIEDVSEYLDSGSEKYRRMVEWIKKDLGVTTLRYQTVDDMVEAIGIPGERLCLDCWLGGKRETDCKGCKGREKVETAI